jgi:hypothetical protein
MKIPRTVESGVLLLLQLASELCNVLSQFDVWQSLCLQCTFKLLSTPKKQLWGRILECYRTKRIALQLSRVPLLLEHSTLQEWLWVYHFLQHTASIMFINQVSMLCKKIWENLTWSSFYGIVLFTETYLIVAHTNTLDLGVLLINQATSKVKLRVHLIHLKIQLVI